MIIEAVVAAVLLTLTFIAVAASDVSAGRTRLYWNLLVLAFAVVALVSEWMHAKGEYGRTRRLVTVVAHWVGVVAVVDLIFLLVWSGRMANADAGLACGAVLALGSYTAGVRGRWLLLVVGIAVAVATAVAAFVEQYVWVLIGIGILAVLIILLGARLRTARGDAGDL